LYTTRLKCWIESSRTPQADTGQEHDASSTAVHAECMLNVQNTATAVSIPEVAGMAIYQLLLVLRGRLTWPTPLGCEVNDCY
jgi:hypothetical protein